MSDAPRRGYYAETDVLRFSPISKEEELEMFRAAKRGDEKMREALILRHLLFALSRASKFCSGNLPSDETTSAANEALMTAIDRFDCERGFKFRSFLDPFIRAAVAKCWRSRSCVNFKHGVPPREVSLDAPQPAPITDDDTEQGGLFHGPDESGAEQREHDDFLRGELAHCAMDLPERDREIIRLHYVEGFNLAEIGVKFGLSRERVRQIHEAILETLKTRMAKRGVTNTR